MKIVVVSGGFDPIHSGHIDYLKNAKELGDQLIVALNSDEWLVNKKGKFFMPFNERKTIIENLKAVDEVISFEDDADGSCRNALEHIKEKFTEDKIIFCNGGDRKKDNIPEMSVSGIEFAFAVGGSNKANSSSWILKEWQYDSEERLWGKYYNLFADDKVKVKELIVSPGKGMSFQKHNFRSEIWYVSKGKCLINFSKDDPEKYEEIILDEESYFHIPVGSWHQITNPYNEVCHLIEIQYGEKTIEEDIERLRYYDESS